MSIIFLVSSIILFFLVPVYYKNVWTKNKTIAFLPGIFKTIGILIIIICVLTPLIIEFNRFPILIKIKELLIILGMIIICLSREKNENGDINSKRIVSLFSSVIIVIIICQVSIVFNIFEIKEFSAFDFSACILAAHLLVFHWYKRNAS